MVVIIILKNSTFLQGNKAYIQVVVVPVRDFRDFSRELKLIFLATERENFVQPLLEPVLQQNITSWLPP